MPLFITTVPCPRTLNLDGNVLYRRAVWLKFPQLKHRLQLNYTISEH